MTLIQQIQEPAVEAHDDTKGGEFLVCAKHMPEVHALGKLLAEMTPDQTDQLKTIVDKADGITT